MSTDINSSVAREFSLLIRGVGRGVIQLLALAAFLFLFSAHAVRVFGYAVPVPVFAAPGESFAALFFDRMRADLVPDGIQLVVTSPIEAFAAQAEIALVIALIALAPVFLVRAAAFFSDALVPHERRALVRAAVPSVLLSIFGAVFAYLFIIPPTFSVLYGYAAPLGAETLLSVGGFVGTVLGLTAAVGAMFTTPVAMVLLTRLGVVSALFWVERWRYALLTLLIVSAIMTPDGSGLTMLIMAVPLVALYGAGCAVSVRVARRPLLN